MILFTIIVILLAVRLLYLLSLLLDAPRNYHQLPGFQTYERFGLDCDFELKLVAFEFGSYTLCAISIHRRTLFSLILLACQIIALRMHDFHVQYVLSHAFENLCLERQDLFHVLTYFLLPSLELL